MENGRSFYYWATGQEVGGFAATTRDEQLFLLQSGLLAPHILEAASLLLGKLNSSFSYIFSRISSIYSTTAVIHFN
jgi:hypothetical protein